MWGYSFKYDYDKAKVINAFNEHNEDVKKRCPKDKLLVFEAKDGWEPLCKFLNVPIPDVPYPNVNDTAAMRRSIQMVNILGWVILIAVLLLLIYVYQRYFL